MDTTQGAPDDELVLLGEWHVRVLVDRELPVWEAEEFGNRIGADLRSSVAGLRERLGAVAAVRVEIDR